ncbi:YkgJ family cysteine cluster protein [Spirochaeta africana]|uniref:Putative Fe-S oxidoreductase n=1 Tax=Spirochaeta africana (strain ATCC 700263 / DSM 8902 / Z-7692) TaxID=889378 RepID=H9UJ62_SPIAZ|nr:YkgJ family cysteine cluster protein [Spirochaeta africana]AFG37555.1 putative Fe-S oxidoreductase [Spirochaeta africana DSM 8902]
MKDFYQHGLQFGCTQCHACCRGEPGYVMLSHRDIEQLATHLCLPTRQFLLQYCRPVERYQGVFISLIEKPNYDCIFWDEGCTVYQARPFQCSSYPFWGFIVNSEESWKHEQSSCPGIGRGKLHSAEHIRALLDQRSREQYAQWSEYFSAEETG